MTTHKPFKSWRRRIIAVAGALALSSTMLLAGVANAAPVTTQPTDPSAPQTGSLTIHKINGQETGQTNDGTVQTVAGTPLSGVTFSVTPVTAKDGTAIDLTKAAGWQLISGTTVSDVTATGGAFTLGTPTSLTTDANGQAAFTHLPLGLYLVQETGQGSNPIVSPAAPFLVTIPLNQKDAQGNATANWLYDVNAYPKNREATGPTKTVSAPDKNLAGTLTWTITQPIPTLNSTDTLKSFSISDALDSRLGYVADSATVAVDGVSLVSGDYTITAPSNGNSNTLTVTFTASGLTKLQGAQGKNVVVTLKTVVTGAGEYTNTAASNINGNEFTSTPQTTEWGGITLIKKDASSSATLAGAVFEIYNSDANGTATGAPLANATTNASGTLSFGPLWVSNNGTPTSRQYVLVETHAPDGYVLDTTPRVVKVTANKEATYVETTVSNTKALVPGLPLTGGQGTMLASVLGALLVAGGAGGAVVARRRKQNA